MKEQFVTYEIAKQLKDLGFDEPCFAIYSGLSENSFAICDTIRLFSSKFKIDDAQSNSSYINNKNYSQVAAPLWQQVIDWLREKHDLIVYISTYQKDRHLFGIFTYRDKELTELGEWISSYEEAREQAILKALELCEKS